MKHKIMRDCSLNLCPIRVDRNISNYCCESHQKLGEVQTFLNSYSCCEESPRLDEEDFRTMIIQQMEECLIILKDGDKYNCSCLK